MKVHAFILTLGSLVGVATAAQAQTASAPADPLTNLQNVFGTAIGESFRVPDQVAAATVPGASAALGPTLGGALRTSLEIPGAAFLALMLPLDNATSASPSPSPAAPAPPPSHSKRAKAHRHREPTQG